MIDSFLQLLFYIFNHSYIKKYFLNIFTYVESKCTWVRSRGRFFFLVALVKSPGLRGYRGVHITVHITIPARVRVRDGSGSPLQEDYLHNAD